jgi:hypothetical protein
MVFVGSRQRREVPRSATPSGMHIVQFPPVPMNRDSKKSLVARDGRALWQVKRNEVPRLDAPRDRNVKRDPSLPMVVQDRHASSHV